MYSPQSSLYKSVDGIKILNIQIGNKISQLIAEIMLVCGKDINIQTWETLVNYKIFARRNK